MEVSAEDMAEAERKGYELERARAQSDVILASAYRRMGRFVPGDVSTLPSRTDNRYNPRKG